MARQKAEHKMAARMKDGAAEVKLLLSHPMETGNRTDPTTGLKVPRHFIRELACDLNGETQLRAQWSWGMARNPYVAIRLAEARPGDRVRCRWTDDRGVEDAMEVIVA
jgi:sulfur-oxidizing protein SoxZ